MREEVFKSFSYWIRSFDRSRSDIKDSGQEKDLSFIASYKLYNVTLDKNGMRANGYQPIKKFATKNRKKPQLKTKSYFYLPFNAYKLKSIMIQKINFL